MDFKYLKLLEENKIKPNFWCSQEYFEKAKFKEIEANKVLYIEDENGDLMFPPINTESGIYPLMLPDGKTSIWAGFSNNLRIPSICTFLDYEYIYDPKAFLNMTGKKWQTFRKNCRKYPARNSELKYRRINPDTDKFNEFVEKWSEETSWDTFHDGNVMLEYLYNGLNREILIDFDGNIHGINIWDENYMFVNYRFCLCLNRPFLSEHMRYLFYINRSKQSKSVNDGGILDNPKLKKFKDKLNPVEINKIYSWRE